MNYFVYDPDDGIEFFETEAEARADAVERLEVHRDCAGDGWPEDVEFLCWGKVVERATLTKCVPAPHEYEMRETEP